MLCMELTIRLLGSGSFGGHVAAFDFGLKCGANVNASICKQNEAFTPNFNSVGHCLQGALSLLLLVEMALPKGAFPLILHLATCFMAGYPVYNIVKRAVKSVSSFAASSFSNNGAEWAMGFVFGISVGLVGIATSTRSSNFGRRLAAASEKNFGTESRSGAWALAEAAVRVLRLISGMLLCGAALVSSVLLGISWDNTAYDVQRDDPVDIRAMIVLLLLPCSLLLAWGGLLVRARRQRERQQGVDPVAGVRSSFSHL